MEWGGVCGSDLAYWRHGASGTAVLTHPLVLGHEVAGRIAAVGAGVTGLEVGHPVTVHPAELVGDGCLPDRLAGRTNLYPQIRYFGSAAFDPHTDGGFSELRVVRADQIRPLPEGVDTEHGALAEPLAVALHAVHRAGDVRGRDVVVNGAGPIGSLVVAAAKYRGAASVVAADLQRRLAGGRDGHGRRRGPQPRDGRRAARGRRAGVRGLGRGRRRWAASSARPPAAARSSRSATCPAPPVSAVLGDLVTREITWIGAYRFVEEISDALLAMRDGLDVSPLITHRFGIEQAEQALAVAADRSSGSSKVMLRLGGAA